jgi:hypothetical protein
LYAKKYDVRRLYGVSLDQLAGILDDQGGCCAICRDKVELMAPRNQGGAAVDHDHATGRVRGMLCIKCIAGLGQFRDNEDHLMRAIAYLRRFTEESNE